MRKFTPSTIKEITSSTAPNKLTHVEWPRMIIGTQTKRSPIRSSGQESQRNKGYAYSRRPKNQVCTI